MYWVIVVIGTLTCYALCPFVRDLISTQMNVQCSLIQEFMLNEFELGHDEMKETKNICCVRSDGAVYCKQKVQEISSSCKNPNDQAR